MCCVVLPIGSPAALAPIMLSTAQGQHLRSLHPIPDTALTPHAVEPASHGEHELCMVLNFISSGSVASWYFIFWRKIEINTYRIKTSQFFIKKMPVFML